MANLPMFSWSRRRPDVGISGWLLILPGWFRTTDADLRTVTLETCQCSTYVLDDFAFLGHFLPCLQQHYEPNVSQLTTGAENYKMHPLLNAWQHAPTSNGNGSRQF